MAQLAKANNITPIVCSILPAYDYRWKIGKKPHIKIPKLNVLVKAIKGTSVLLGLFSSMVDDRNGMQKAYTTDEVHVTEEGYVVMEKIVMQAITEVLKKRKP